MKYKDVIIIGGGPAGSACAWQLGRNGVDCLILDSQKFPRLKLCAGWVTPELFRDLEMDPVQYPYGLTSFSSFEITIKNFQFRLPTRQYAIRRFEFDDFLLRRSGIILEKHSVKAIHKTNNGFIMDDHYACKYLVGAGGTHCPVNRQIFPHNNRTREGSLIVAMEEEFPYPFTDDRCQLWFFQNDLPGYAWYVPKMNGFVNVGVGGKETKLKASGDSIRNHWNRLTEMLELKGLIINHSYKPAGHSYYLNSNRREIQSGNAYLVGDAAGLSTLDMGEGIYPAVKSGMLAADAIVLSKQYQTDSISKYSFKSILRIPTF